MDKNEVLLFGALLESDKWQDGYGSTDEDTELLQTALKKVYRVNDYALEEELQDTERQLNEDMRNLMIEYRDKIKNYLEV